MNIVKILRFLDRAFFWIWTVTLLLIIGYFFLVRSVILVVKNSSLTALVEINFLSGVLVILCLFLEFILNNFKKIVSKLIFIVIIISAFCFWYYGAKRQASPGVVVQNIGSNVALARSFYLSLFFEVFGMPVDTQMATADEIFEAVNRYRKTNGLSDIVKDDELCRIAEKDLAELMSIATRQQHQLIREIEGLPLNRKATEIIEVRNQPSSGKHIVENLWARPLSQQQKILLDPSFTLGCSAVSGYNIVFVFGK